ncbi:hypothetical protein [Microbacterium sp. GXF7504]
MTVSTHAYTATVLGEDIPLDIVGGSITMSATSAPHVAGDLTVTAKSDLLDHIDPRDNSIRIRIEADAVVGAVSQSRYFDLGLRDREVSQSDGTVTLSLASDEALLNDYAPLTDVDLLTYATSLRSLVERVLSTAIPGADLEASPSIDHAFSGYEDDAFTWKAGQSALNFLAPLVQAAGFRLVCDERRAWTLRDEDYIAPGVLSIRYAINMIDGTESISRDTGLWHDAAVTRYRWVNGAGETLEQIDAYALTTPYSRLLLIEKDTPYPGAGFSAYAVRRAQYRGREVTATAVADWRVQPEMYAQIVLNGAPTQTGAIDSVTFDLDQDRMTVATRTVDTPPLAWVLGPDELVWDDIEPTLTWADITAWADLEDI